MLFENLQMDYVKHERISRQGKEPLQFLTFGKKYQCETMIVPNEFDFTGLNEGDKLLLSIEFKKDNGYNYKGFIKNVSMCKS